MINFKSIKTQLILYLTVFAVFLFAQDKNAAFIWMTIVSVVAAVGAEAIAGYFSKKTFRITESAVITGLIVGYVLSSDEPVWKFVAAASAAILSKYLIRFQKRHLLNPAAFGVFITSVLLGAQTQWKGTYVWYVLIPCGLYYIFKIGKMEILVSYFLVSLTLFGTQAVSQGVSLLNVFGYFSYFYIFVMVIEPKTSPVSLPGKYLFGAFLAGLIFTVTQIGVRFDAEIFCLLAMNLAVPFFNRFSIKKAGMS